jgi:hypothetical protein
MSSNYIGVPIPVSAPSSARPSRDLLRSARSVGRFSGCAGGIAGARLPVERAVTRRYAQDVDMPTLEERVTYLEGQVSEHTQTLMEIRDS